MKRSILLSVLLSVAVALAAGCGGGVSEDQPVSEVKADAAGMNADQLKAKVAEYVKAIDAKKADLVTVRDKIQQLKIEEMMGEKAKDLQAQADQIGDSIRNLTERVKIYQDQLAAKMFEAIKGAEGK